VFLHVSQAFDKVWHKGLLIKLRDRLPHSLYLILKSYLTDREFQAKYNQTTSYLYPIQSGVPQGRVWAPVFANLPINIGIEIAKFADNIAILASDLNHITASQKL
jgi:hypothetical protein